MDTLNNPMVAMFLEGGTLEPAYFGGAEQQLFHG